MLCVPWETCILERLTCYRSENERDWRAVIRKYGGSIALGSQAILWLSERHDTCLGHIATASSRDTCSRRVVFGCLTRPERRISLQEPDIIVEAECVA